MSSQLYTFGKFFICYKEETYKSQGACYQGDVVAEIKDSFSRGARQVNESIKKKIAKGRRKSEGGIVSSIRRKMSIDYAAMKQCHGDEKEGFVSPLLRKISTNSLSIRRKMSTYSPSFDQKVSMNSPSLGRKISTNSSSYGRKISSNSPMAMQCLEVGDMITEKDVELLNLSVQQEGDEVTITILNDIDARWLRKSIKIFFRSILLQNELI